MCLLVCSAIECCAYFYIRRLFWKIIHRDLPYASCKSLKLRPLTDCDLVHHLIQGFYSFLYLARLDISPYRLKLTQIDIRPLVTFATVLRIHRFTLEKDGVVVLSRKDSVR